MPKFKLQRGMFLVITRTLQHETPEIVGWAWKYEDIWNYWMDNPDREWDLAHVRGQTIITATGEQEFLQVWRINKPIPPDRYNARLQARKRGGHN